ncbi:restriction endonuclease subunit S [Photobacterium damselae subsp. damselae]|uniref:restriction endonuclease subunit S n=1 Tax=Photobacterium damselae TaxID=38293 RepID=UPI00311B2E3C
MMDSSLLKMPTYDSYTETHIPELGKIPSDWKLKKFKYLSVISKGVMPKNLVAESSRGLPVYLSMEYLRGGDAKVYVDDKKANVLPDNEILLLWDGSNSGEFIRSREGVISSTVAHVKFKSIENDYAWFACSITEKLLRQSTVGMGIPHVDGGALKNSYLPVPPVEERVQITRFLSGKVGKVDEAIAIKQKQIELLKERKQIIIQQAVTQGLNLGATMKDSGVDWIGEIPEHWGIVRFKNLFTQSRLPVRKGDGVVTSYRDGQVTLRSNRRVGGYTEAILEGGYQGIRKGQLVLNSMDAFEGAIGVSDSDGKCTPEYVICDPINSVNVSQYYFAYLLREMALAKYIQVICNAVRQRAVRIRYNNLAPLFMVVPPVKEQEDIVSFIEKESSKLDAGTKHLNEQISKLKEYKTTLINSAVTGKIKVTELA